MPFTPTRNVSRKQTMGLQVISRFHLHSTVGNELQSNRPKYLKKLLDFFKYYICGWLVANHLLKNVYGLGKRDGSCSSTS